MQPQTNSGTLTFDSAPVTQDTPVSELSKPQQNAQASTSPTDNSGLTFDSAPVSQDTPASALSSFQTPSGNTYTPGQQVQHSSGTTGTVTGQHPDTQQAIVQWNQNHPGQKYGVEGTMRANDVGAKDVFGQAARWADQVSNDIKYGTDITGIGAFLKKMGAHGVYTGNPEAVGNFMASIPLGLLTAVKGQAEMAGAGAKGTTRQAVRQGVQGLADTAQGEFQAGTMPSMVMGGPEAGEAALGEAGELASNAASKVADAVQAGKNAASKVAASAGKVARKVYPEAIEPENVATADHNFQQTVQPLYDELHAGVRNAVADAAEKAGVTVKPTESIQDMAMDAAKAFRAKATKLYSQVDDAIEAATGRAGRFQAHDENLEALHDKLADSIGDTEAQAKYAKAIQEEEAAKQASLGHIKDAGLGDAPKQASALHKQGRALEDLGKKVQANTDGLPGDAGNPERLNPKTFATSLKNLKNNTRYGGSRLGQAIGPDNATTLIQQTNDTRTALRQAEQVEAQRVADNAAKAAQTAQQRKLVKGAAWTAAGAGTGLVGKEGFDIVTGAH